ncbi:MAG: alpha/beta hydrolase [Wenzhouxiangella sp.]|nr:alpha/beta hydrolase [Wenzhouxiangella sp.]
MSEREVHELRTGSGLFFRRHGAAQDSALILCHGLASNSSRWNELGKNIQLPPGWCLICPDLRGHGNSQRRGRLSSGIWMADLLELFADQGLNRGVLGGHCMGANLAMRMASRHAESVQGLVLVEPMLPQARKGRMRVKSALRWLLPLLALAARGANLIGISRGQRPVLDLEALDLKTRAAMEKAGDSSAMTSRYASPLPDLQYIPTHSYLQALTETLRRLPPLSDIKQPALGLISSGGLFGDPDLTRQALATMPDCQIATLEAEHWIPTEQPQALRELLSRWLITRFG